MPRPPSILDQPVGTTKSDVHRALQLLREALAQRAPSRRSCLMRLTRELFEDLRALGEVSRRRTAASGRPRRDRPRRSLHLARHRARPGVRRLESAAASCAVMKTPTAADFEARFEARSVGSRRRRPASDRQCWLAGRFDLARRDRVRTSGAAQGAGDSAGEVRTYGWIAARDRPAGARCARWGRRCARIRCRCSSPAIGWSAVMARSASYALGGSTAKRTMLAAEGCPRRREWPSWRGSWRGVAGGSRQLAERVRRGGAGTGIAP